MAIIPWRSEHLGRAGDPERRPNPPSGGCIGSGNKERFVSLRFLPSSQPSGSSVPNLYRRRPPQRNRPNGTGGGPRAFARRRRKSSRYVSRYHGVGHGLGRAGDLARTARRVQKTEGRERALPLAFPAPNLQIQEKKNHGARWKSVQRLRGVRAISHRPHCSRTPWRHGRRIKPANALLALQFAEGNSSPMSGHLAGAVWFSALDRELKPLAATIADFANDEGAGIFCSIDYLAWRLSSSRSLVERGLRELREAKVLVVLDQGGGRNRTTAYRLVKENLPYRPKWEPKSKPRQFDVVQETTSSAIETTSSTQETTSPVTYETLVVNVRETSECPACAGTSPIAKHSKDCPQNPRNSKPQRSYPPRIQRPTYQPSLAEPPKLTGAAAREARSAEAIRRACERRLRDAS